MAFQRLSLLLMVLSLSACGFHLKGYQQEASPALDDLFVIGGDQRNTLAGMLQRNLRIAGVNLADNTESARNRLQIVQEQMKSRVLAVDASGKALDSEFRLLAGFRLTPASGESQEVQSLELVRQLSYSGTDELGQRNEAALLMEDMRNEMANQIIRRLEAQLD
ncbi:MAG: hypothetical protein KZQ73_03795 [Candidatus Thiodiazotropha sp. (ex Semelilucina semeliformis)]|nr:hypothetical protein [Candidatus Thiodiazotropha sp. (ex Semelilucina semeliformis)]MCU7828711.1 hypothetical protein [Candidatus Thiodiazotropha sp. (ex Myrtea sp. 'scaly one' KF741663)]